MLAPILLYLIAVLVLAELDQDGSGLVSLREHYYQAPRERVHRVLPVLMLILFLVMVVLTSLRPG